MKRFLEKKYVNTGFIIALIILISINILTYLDITWHFQDEKYQTLALQTIQSSDELMGKVTQAETSRRGYLITNTSDFVIEYYEALKQIDTSYYKLRALAKDDKTELELVDTLGFYIHNRKDLLQESLEMQVESSKPNMKGQIEYTTKGKETQDKIRNLINSIKLRENEILRSRFEEADVSSQYTLTNLFVGTAVAFALLILSITLLNRNISARKQFEKEIEESRNWLYTTLTSIGDAVIVTDKMGEVMFMNETAQNLTNWNEDEAKGLYIEQVFKVIDEDTGGQAENPVITSLKTGKIVISDKNVLLVTKEGNEIPIDQTAAPIKDNELTTIGMVLVFRDVTAKRKTENEIRSSQRFIQRIADSIPNILYIYDLSGPSVVYANSKISDILGFSVEEIKNTGSGFIEKFMHPDDIKRLRAQYQRFSSAGDSDVLDYEFRIRNSKGEWRWMHSYDIVFTRTSEGLASQILGTALDVTERKKLEDELKKYSGHLEELVEIRTSELKRTNEKLKLEITERARAEKNIIDAEEKFRSLVENSLAGIYIIQDGKFAYVNPRYEEIYGYSKGELLLVNPLDLVHEDDKAMLKSSFDSLLSNIKQIDQLTHRGQKKDGSTIVLELGATKIYYLGKRAVIGTLIDITIRKHIEDEIRAQREFLRTVIDLSPNLIFAKDRDGHFTLVNKAVAEIYGTTVGELLGKTDADFNSDLDEVNHFLEADRRVIDSGEELIIPEEPVSNSRTNTKRWYQTIKIPLVTSGNEKQVLGVSSDITSRKLAEELTRKNLREKEMLLQEIHHRVKNNLQIIVSLLKLQSRYITDPRDLEIFSNSRARVETMSLIHEKLYKSKDISRIDFDSYIKELAGYLLKAYKVHQDDVQIEICAKDVYLGIDTAIPCGLIINELVINTLKYAFPEGRKGKIRILVTRENEFIKLVIGDDGIGLPETFDIRSSESLGLQLVDTLMRQLDGTVQLDNLNGTVFTFRFREVKYKERI